MRFVLEAQRVLRCLAVYSPITDHARRLLIVASCPLSHLSGPIVPHSSLPRLVQPTYCADRMGKVFGLWNDLDYGCLACLVSTKENEDH